MYREEMKQDRARLKAILADIESGKITFQQGQDDYLADLRRRISRIENNLSSG